MQEGKKKRIDKSQFASPGTRNRANKLQILRKALKDKFDLYQTEYLSDHRLHRPQQQVIDYKKIYG